MTEIKHLQSVILGIMKDIDNICQKHGIQYYLLGGSAIGAIRHHGFIPWDDDLDIIMDHANYERFITVCKTELDPGKYALQEGLKDWSMCFSKVRLLGTRLEEANSYTHNPAFQGIYVDVFKMDNVSNSKLISRWQYFCGKVFLCYQLLSRGDRKDGFSFKKRVMMCLASPLKAPAIRRFFQKQVERFNDRPTDYYGFFYGRTKYRTAIVKKALFGNPLRVQFEDTMLPVAERYDEYLTQMFGDYMTPPPVEQQKGVHLSNVDFGSY